MFAAGIAVTLAALLAIPAAASAELSYPLPGGKYKGKTNRDRAVKIVMSSESANGKIRGRFKLPCADISKRFTLDDPDGSFKVKKRNNGGKTVFRAKGQFTKLEKAKGKLKKVDSDKRRCKTGKFRTKVKGHKQIERATVSYGHDVHPSEGGHGGGAHANVVDRPEPPCENCYVIGMSPDLVHEDGSSANHATNAMLHHTVLMNLRERDPTCNGWPQRFFASGNERTDFVLPQGYGYLIEPDDNWRTITHLVNSGQEMQRLTVEIEFWYVRAPADIEPVSPLWLDVANCTNSEYTIPAGESDKHWDYTVSPRMAGNVVAIGGHVHNQGVQIEATNAIQGGSICRSVAGYGTIPEYMGNIESMTGCVGDPVARINAGDVLRLHSEYDSPVVQHDVMGIMMAYVDTDAE